MKYIFYVAGAAIGLLYVIVLIPSAHAFEFPIDELSRPIKNILPEPIQNVTNYFENIHADVSDGAFGNLQMRTETWFQKIFSISPQEFLQMIWEFLRYIFNFAISLIQSIINVIPT